MCKNEKTSKTPGHLSPEHDYEHDRYSRRSFLQTLGLAGGGCIVLGGGLYAAYSNPDLISGLFSDHNDNVLVLIQLEGGNDGLNTIVPVFDYDVYARNRPAIGHMERDLIRLTENYAIPKYLKNFESLWKDGEVNVLNGVGYQNQNLSHFRSSKIWSSCNPDNKEDSGWWGRYFEQAYPDFVSNAPKAPLAIQIGHRGSMVFEGNRSNFAFSLSNIEQLRNIPKNPLYDLANPGESIYKNQLSYVKGISNATQVYSEVINTAYTSSANKFDYGKGSLGKQLATVARLIKGGLGSKIYMVSLTGFDTHVNQVNWHRKLLEDLSQSIRAFYSDINESHMKGKVMSVTISEFGRRLKENASKGTDHGTASPMFIFGGKAAHNGFTGSHPDLTQLDQNGNLIPTTDFRDVYGMILDEWFGMNSKDVNQILLRSDASS